MSNCNSSVTAKGHESPQERFGSNAVRGVMVVMFAATVVPAYVFFAYNICLHSDTTLWAIILGLSIALAVSLPITTYLFTFVKCCTCHFLYNQLIRFIIIYCLFGAIIDFYGVASYVNQGWMMFLLGFLGMVLFVYILYTFIEHHTISCPGNIEPGNHAFDLAKEGGWHKMQCFCYVITLLCLLAMISLGWFYYDDIKVDRDETSCLP